MPSHIPDHELFTRFYNPNDPNLRNHGIRSIPKQKRVVLDFKALREEFLRKVSEEDQQGAASQGHGDK